MPKIIEKTILSMNSQIENLRIKLQKNLKTNTFLTLQGELEFHKYDEGLLIFKGGHDQEGTNVVIRVDSFNFAIFAEYEDLKGTQFNIGILK